MNTKTLKKANTGADDSAKDWHPSFVVAALHEAGWTLSSLAEQHGLTGPGTLSKALRSSFPIAEKRIADALGLHPKDIWPSRYEKDGTRKLVGFHAIQSTRRRNSVNAKLAKMNSHESA
ncbi:MAG: Nlp family transcriptional regulator [Proteobacteria bacterium ST_bin11]|nr:MAG: Nlp family transcriptional regulator [Proteobacteria bacterium ST_bin11]